MRTLNNLQQAITGFDDEPMEFDGVVMTIKDLLVQYVGSYTSDNPTEMVETWEIGPKLSKAKNKIELEDREFLLLKKMTDKPKHINLLYSPMRKYLDAVKEKEEKKEKKK